MEEDTWKSQENLKNMSKLVEEFEREYERAEKEETRCHKLHLAITPQILALFLWSKMHLKALMKTFQTMPKTCQSNQYSLRYQLISAEY